MRVLSSVVKSSMIVMFVAVLVFGTIQTSAQRFEVDAIDCSTLIDGETSLTDFVEKSNYYTEHGQYGLGLLYATCAIELYPDIVDVYVTRAAVFELMDETDLALADLATANDLNPEYVEVLSKMIEIYDSQNDLEQMLSLYDSIIKIEPDNAEHYIDRGYVNELLLDFDAALNDYNTAIEIDDKAYKAYSNRGIVYSQLGDLEQAFTDLNFAIEQNPGSAHAYLARAHVYYYLRDYDAARNDLENALEINPNDTDSLQSLDTVYLLLGEALPEQYREQISQLTILDPPRGHAANIEYLDPDEVIQEYDRIIALNPQSSYAHTYRARAYTTKGEYENAIADSYLAIEINPQNPRPYLQLLALYLSVFGDYEQAFLILEQGIMSNPDDPDLHYYLGVVYADYLGDNRAALGHYDKYLELVGENVDESRLNHILEFKYYSGNLDE